MVFAEKRQETAETKPMRRTLNRCDAPALVVLPPALEQREIAYGNVRFRNQRRQQ